MPLAHAAGAPRVAAPAFPRERLAGLSVGAYVGAKVAVLLPVLAGVAIVLLGVLRGLDRLPPAGDDVYASLFVTLLIGVRLPPKGGGWWVAVDRRRPVGSGEAGPFGRGHGRRAARAAPGQPRIAR
jgi:asparagine N-glycosylation enzyme membrane subunit Stt3